jgi:DNA-binding winged helix-turn-helix (wHTH) protein/tetratricopeptide (TPR) repeat protein
MLPASVPNSVVRFGVFEADLRTSELRKSGAKVKIQDLPFRALKLLLSRPNEVLSREQFRHALWPEGVFVDFDHGISSAINRLRDALGDSADNPVFIETVERRGYRWIAPASFAPNWGGPATIGPAATGPGQVSAAPVWTTPAHLPPPAAPGPVLVKPSSEPPVGPVIPIASQRSSRSLLLFLAALVIAVGMLGLSHRASNAGTAAAAAKHPTAGQPASAPRSSSSEAEQFYLQGRFYWEKRTPDGLNKAVDFFTQAIVHDSNYAPAYVGLADCYNLLREYTLMPASEAYPRALAAAKRAVELDDRSSEAHASLAFALFYGNWDAAGAEREFRRALELNPNSSVAHHWYATYLGALDRYPEAVAEIQRAQALDPASKSILADEGDILWSSGRREEGIALLKQLEVAEPDFLSPHRYLKTVYFAGGDYPRYLEEWKQEASLMRDPSGLKLVETAEKGLAAGGVQGMLQNIRTLQINLYGRGLQSPYLLAETDAFLGNKQEALAYLKISYDKHEEYVAQIEADPAFNNLHDEPAYKEFVARLGFPAKK